MGFRFRKSISLGKFARINVGKRDIGMSTGVKGARVGIGSKGAYSSVGIPGTGVSNVTHYGKGGKLAPASSSNFTLGCIGLLVMIGVVALLFVSPYLALGLAVVAIIAGAYYQNARKRKEATEEANSQQIE